MASLSTQANLYIARSASSVAWDLLRSSPISMRTQPAITLSSAVTLPTSSHASSKGKVLVVYIPTLAPELSMTRLDSTTQILARDLIAESCMHLGVLESEDELSIFKVGTVLLLLSSRYRQPSILPQATYEPGGEISTQVN